MADPNHPIWSFARVTVVLISLTITLWANASHFDSTELWSIGVIFVVLAGGETATYVLSHFRLIPKKDDQEN
tara:strand:+ start:653 stop:868 length:216 start_codon:yes stop_codon:yes gene_type:complete